MADVSGSLPVVVTAILLVIGAIITGVFGLLNHRTDARAKKEPSMTEIWARLDKVEAKLSTETRARQSVEDLLRRVRFIFLDYVDRVQSGGSADLTADERAALEETKETT